MSHPHLLEARARWSQRPAEPEDAWLGERPDWLKDSDGIIRLFDDGHLLYSHGEVIWGKVFIANSVLWGPQAQSAPFVAVHSRDTSIDRHPELMDPTMHSLTTLRDAATAPAPELVDLHQNISGDLRRFWHLQLPACLTAGRVVWISTPLAWPQQLPGGHLADSLIPLVAAPRHTPVVMILPRTWWARPHVEAWEGSSAEREPSQ